MPLSCAEGLGTAQIAFVIAQHETACQVGCPVNLGLRDGLARCARWFSLMGFCDGTACDGLVDVLHHVRQSLKKIEIPNYLIYIIFSRLARARPKRYPAP